jgi:hypothetical protein
LTIVWLVVKFAIYTWVLVVIYRQSYNFVLFLARRPIAWLVSITLFAILHMAVAYYFAWTPGLVSLATLATFVLNLAPSRALGVSRAEIRSVVDDAYRELGLPHGRIQARLGLVSFGVFSLAGYILLFGEICRGTECTPIFKALFHG